MNFCSRKSITFIFISAFLLIGSAFSYAEQSSSSYSVQLLEKHSQEEYHALADEVLRRMKIPELHEKIIEYSKIDKVKTKNLREALSRKKEGHYSEENINQATQEYLKIWDNAYHTKLKYDNIKGKIINKIITKVSYSELYSLNDVLKHGGKRGYTNQDTIAFVLIRDSAMKTGMEASLEAADETRLALHDILTRMDLRAENNLLVT